MNRLKQLPEIAEHQLGGLEAGQTLLCKIRIEAAEKKSKPKTAAMLRPVLAVCAALVLCVGAVAALNPGEEPVLPLADTPMLASYSAGREAASAPRMAAEVPKGSVTMSAGMRRFSDSLFTEPENPNAGFPLVTMNGATYRMLNLPAALDTQLMGDVIGRVNEFNLEPALGSSGVISNVIDCGEDVYAVKDLSGALVAANVDGAMRVFQRVSYAGAAVIGAETLGDTLCKAQDVAWIELEGAGRAEGEAAQRLMDTLLSYADYENTAFSGSQSMQIGLSNGLVLQLMTGEDSVSACGTWSCPDFFEAFYDAVK